MRCFGLWLMLAPALAAQSPAVLAGLTTGGYFPLDVGDRWVYRIDTRVQTASYETWRVDRTAALNGSTYAVFAIEGPGTFYYEMYYRADASGRVYTPTANGGEQLFLDPTGQLPGATLQIISKGGAAQSSLGTFPNALGYVNNLNELTQETGVLVQGLGLLSSTAILLTGSSGGDTQIRTLVEAEVAGGIIFPAPTASVQLGIDNLAPERQRHECDQLRDSVLFRRMLHRGRGSGGHLQAVRASARGAGELAGQREPFRAGAVRRAGRLDAVQLNLDHGRLAHGERDVHPGAAVFRTERAAALGNVPISSQERRWRGAIGIVGPDPLGATVQTPQAQ